MPKFSANLTMMFNEADFIDRFAAASEAGFRGVEFLFPYAYDKTKLMDLLFENELQMILFNMPAGKWDAGDRGITCDPSRTAEFQDNVGKAVDYALTLGCGQLHAMAGIMPSGVSEDRMWETYIANLKFASAELKKHGLKLVIEAINTRDMPGYFLNRTWQGLDAIDEVGADNIFLQYDIYHMQIMEGDLSHTIETNLPQIAHMQMADTPGRHEPGTGEINYNFLFEFIDDLGYEGWIGCEYKPLGATAAGLSWFKPYRK
jgi:hydroxypyruvate isomerase